MPDLQQKRSGTRAGPSVEQSSDDGSSSDDEFNGSADNESSDEDAYNPPRMPKVLHLRKRSPA
jgi:hypothetical protein